jgi:hypothetical protein
MLFWNTYSECVLRGKMTRAEPSGRNLTSQDASIVKGMLDRGDRHHDIAAWFGINQGRIAEIKQGLSYEDALAIGLSELPPPGPYSSGRAAHRAIKALEEAKTVLDFAKNTIDSALVEIKQGIL